MKTKRGFSLTELLVVVLIIGILTSLALPGYEKASQKAVFAEVEIILDTIMKDVDAYAMANGYKTGVTTTDIVTSIPWECASPSYGRVWCNTKVGKWDVRGESQWGESDHYDISYWPDTSKLYRGGYQFSKYMGEPWVWQNKHAFGNGMEFASYNKTFQFMCDWWIKQGGRPYSGPAKTIIDEHCGV